MGIELKSESVSGVNPKGELRGMGSSRVHCNFEFDSFSL